MSQKIVHRGPCPQPECETKEGFNVYADNTGYCFACDTFVRQVDPDAPAGQEDGFEGEPETLFLQAEPIRLNRRRISLETCEAWEYGVSQWKGMTVHVATFRDPKNGGMLFQKIRTPDKDFRVIGDYRPVLWGQHRWASGGKMVVVTEGEIDCLSVSELWGNRFPVVSIPNGVKSAVASVENGMDWLATFDRVVLCFDSDDAGKEAASACAAILPPGKAFICQLPLKDANEMVTAGRSADLRHHIWSAKEFRPDGILTGDEIAAKVEAEAAIQSTPLPWESLNDLTHGVRGSEILTIGAGSGTGKTTFVREIAAWLLSQGHKVGCFFFEDTLPSAMSGFVGIGENRRLYVDRPEDMENLHERIKAMPGAENLTVYDYDGRVPKLSDLAMQVRYMARGRGCRWIVLDHLSYLIGATDLSADERRTLDLAMTELRAVVMETGVGLILVNHLKRAEGRGHEEGGRVHLNHFRGSGSIAQLSNTVIGLERDQQDDDERDVVVPRVLKCRLTGKTGAAASLYYNHDTGRLTEGDARPLMEAADETNSDF